MSRQAEHHLLSAVTAVPVNGATGRLCLVTALVFGGPGLLFAPAQATGMPPRQLKAQDFMHTFGVNVHFNENNYHNTQAIADALNIIGLSRVRSSCVNAAEIAAWLDLATKCRPYFPAGLKADVLINGYLNAPNVTLASQERTVPQIAALVESIEGPNEINNYSVGHGTHGPHDLADQTGKFSENALAWAQALSAWKKETPALAHARLLAPCIASGDPADYARLPDVSAFVDAGNLHFYAGNGRPPSNFEGGNFAALYRWCRAAATPHEPVALTEWGQTTARRPGQGGCDEATQAKYVLNQMCDAVAMDVEGAYLYQLMDDTADGDPKGDGGSEAHYGVFDYRWRVKPAAQALANVKNLLADSSSEFTATPPGCRVHGPREAGAAGSSLLISKSDGSTFIVVWNEPQLWDPKSNGAITPKPDAVEVDLDGEYGYRVYDPLVGLEAVAAGRSSRVEVKLFGSPLMIQILADR